MDDLMWKTFDYENSKIYLFIFLLSVLWPWLVWARSTVSLGPGWVQDSPAVSIVTWVSLSQSFCQYWDLGKCMPVLPSVWWPGWVLSSPTVGIGTLMSQSQSYCQYWNLGESGPVLLSVLWPGCVWASPIVSIVTWVCLSQSYRQYCDLGESEPFSITKKDSILIQLF